MKKLTVEECLEIGGHCWNYYSANTCVDEFGNKQGNKSGGWSHAVYYPNGEPRYRTCKHCGFKQREQKAKWVDK